MRFAELCLYTLLRCVLMVIFCHLREGMILLYVTCMNWLGIFIAWDRQARGTLFVQHIGSKLLSM